MKIETKEVETLFAKEHKTIKCKYCGEPLNEMEYEAFLKDGKPLCYNWENEIDNEN